MGRACRALLLRAGEGNSIAPGFVGGGCPGSGVPAWEGGSGDSSAIVLPVTVRLLADVRFLIATPLVLAASFSLCGRGEPGGGSRSRDGGLALRALCRRFALRRRG